MRKVLLAACVAALALYGPARAAGADPNRLFPDSRLVVKDRISVEVVGQGPDLVLIPGLASSRETWKAAAERLKGRYRLHLIQVAGFAGEPARANASGEVVAPTEEAIDAYIREQKLGPATVIGHSLGGTITLLLAEKHSDDLKRAFIVDSLPFYGMAMAGPMATPANMQAGAAKARDQILAATPEQFRASSAGQMVGMVSDPAMREKITGWSIASDRSVMARAMYEDLQLDLRPELGKISTPITLLYPDYTPVGAPPGSMTQMYPPAFAPAATIKPVQVEHSLHFIMLDQPAVFDKALDEFLAH
jgi:pimeloyl-[acyl-carrier protein] methyl ester esterase